MTPTATSLIKAIEKLLNFGNVKTSPIIDLDKKVSMNALIKDDNGIFRNFNITVKEIIPPVEPERYIKTSEIYKDIFD